LVFLVGVPFAPPTPRTAKLLRRLSEIFGGDENREKLHGIILPGLWAALQAAGRAIRGPEDSADIFLIDDRYVLMTRLLPRWFRERVVGTIQLADLPMHLEVRQK
jgi:Rad3-related DNA helicase